MKGIKLTIALLLMFVVVPLTNAGAEEVGIKYQVCIKGDGWENVWHSNGQMAGTTGKSKRIEQIIIKTSGLPFACKLTYRTHVRDDGWGSWVYENGISGSLDQKRIEAIQAKLNNCPDWSVFYNVHMKDIGWYKEGQIRRDGEIAGTTGQSRRIEAIKIWLKKRDTDNGKISIRLFANNEDGEYVRIPESGTYRIITKGKWRHRKGIRYYDPLHAPAGSQYGDSIGVLKIKNFNDNSLSQYSIKGQLCKTSMKNVKLHFIFNDKKGTYKDNDGFIEITLTKID